MTTLDERVLERVRSGALPDGDRVAEVVAADIARYGLDGARARASLLSRDLLGLGPLGAVIEMAGVTDVLVNGDGSVWFDAGDGVTRCTTTLAGPDEVRRLAVRLAGLAGRRLDDGQPWVDGDLPNGVRLHAVLPPVAGGGAHVSLRIPRREGWRLDALHRLGMLDARAVRVLRAVVARRCTFVVSGGAGTGKTSLLSALLAEADPGERIVIVEDVRELRVGHPHVVSLQGRAPNVEGAGAVTLVDLVRQALRMRPDRLVVGEVRGAEVRELLAALNTGHRGGCGTVHANSAEQVPARFAALGALAGLSGEAVDRQLDGAVDLVLHLDRHGDLRTLACVGLVEGARVVPALVRGSGGATVAGPGLEALARLLGPEEAPW